MRQRCGYGRRCTRGDRAERHPDSDMGFGGLTGGAQAVRAFGADAGLSKSDVTERVMTVVKAFNKVEASKVRLPTCRSSHETPTHKGLSPEARGAR